MNKIKQRIEVTFFEGIKNTVDPYSEIWIQRSYKVAKWNSNVSFVEFKRKYLRYLDLCKADV